MRAERAQGFGDLGLVGERTGDHALEVGIRRVRRGRDHQRRQRQDALAQVGARRLAGRVGGDVEDVVGQLEHHADLFAVGAEGVQHLPGGSADHAPEARRRGDQRPGLVGHHVEIVPQPVVPRPRTARLRDLALHQPGERLGLQRHVVGAQGGHRRRRAAEQVVADQDGHRVVPARVRAVDAAAHLRLVHDVVVVEARDVRQLHHDRGAIDAVGLGARQQLGGEHHQQRAEALAARLDDVGGRLGHEVGIGARSLA